MIWKAWKSEGNNWNIWKDMESPWYQNPIFKHYWKNYNATFSWFKSNRGSLLGTNCKCSCSQQSCEHQIPVVPNRSCSPSSIKSFNSSCLQKFKNVRADANKVRSKRSKKRKRTRSSSASSHHSDARIEMMVTEDMISFLEQSVNHKLELEEARKIEKEGTLKGADCFQALEKMKLANSQVLSSGNTSAEQNKLKSCQMQLLYGSSAAMIQGMETAMQLSFDRFMDTKQPDLWPNLPLKF